MSTIATSSAASMPHEHAHEEHHENNTVFGFWLYLMTDCLLFASFFATYAVLFGLISCKNSTDFIASILLINNIQEYLLSINCLNIISISF